MNGERVSVRSVRGRLPHRAGKIESRHVTAQVQEDGDRVCIRLDNENVPEFWLELTLELGVERAK